MTDASRLVEEAQRIADIRERLAAVQEAYRNNEVDVFNRAHHASWDDVEWLLAALQQAQASRIEPLKRSEDPEEAESMRVTPDYVLMTRSAADAQSVMFHRVREERDALRAREQAQPRPEIPASLKRLDTPEAREFWQSVEQAAKDWEAQEPDWSRRLRAASDGRYPDTVECIVAVLLSDAIDRASASTLEQAQESWIAAVREMLATASPRERGEQSAAPQRKTLMSLRGLALDPRATSEQAAAPQWQPFHDLVVKWYESAVVGQFEKVQARRRWLGVREWATWQNAKRQAAENDGLLRTMTSARRLVAWLSRQSERS